MRILSYSSNGQQGLAVEANGRWLDVGAADPWLPTDVAGLVALPNWRRKMEQAVQGAPERDLSNVMLLPPVRTGQKILCVGLNYLDHVAESPYKQPTYPTFFLRAASSLIAHEQPLIKPRASEDFDYEGELVAVIGKTARHVKPEHALDHVAGYTIFNEGSVRDYQFKAPQWTMGKNFDGTGACGPWFVSADELPQGAKGLQLVTRVNGAVEQRASTDDMLFDVATLVSLASEVMTLLPGDMLVTGTPAGVGFGKKPPVYLKAGDVCEVEIEGIGLLRNKVEEEAA
ncbi:fumarylacetoacetate hydrolase [Variovorax sp. WS11]|nr:fumarylacetoacetate hydrolase family protein [Variovorax sp. WS11]NDZ17516.1 fumarylacetoacetate hydrolase family protein [Variovorax sp. WS11]PSL85954.1 fumarylacetoacetate hydrolase [Variovorax sp. WS11]